LVSVLPGGPIKGSASGSVYLRAESDISETFRKGAQWGFIEDPEVPAGTMFRLILCLGQPDYATVEIVSTLSGVSPSMPGGCMTGSVYDGVVVKNTQVAAGVGLTSSVPKSEIVLTVNAFIAKDDVTAQAVMLSAAKDSGLELDDPTTALEVKIRKFA
jgi:hypothetical protein